MEKYLCKFCGIQLVETDKNGKLTWGIHERGCPATITPENDGPARKAAKTKLICRDCPNQHSDIIDAGGDLVYCSACPHAGLVKSARAADTNKSGTRGANFEIIHSADRKTVGFWKRLYLDLLQKYVIVLAKLEQYEKG